MSQLFHQIRKSTINLQSTFPTIYKNSNAQKSLLMLQNPEIINHLNKLINKHVFNIKSDWPECLKVK